MMTFKKSDYTEAFVWIWLPGKTEPVVAGKLSVDGKTQVFNYGKSYLERKDAIPLYDVELPLQSGFLPLLNGLSMPGCIRDGAPDAWGRRVILNWLSGTANAPTDLMALDELTCLLESGSDRIGALDFQHSPTLYEPRLSANATLEDLLASAEYIEKGLSLPPALDQVLRHASSIGGARPKALIEDNEKKYIAKFTSSTDLYSVIKAEFIAMRLAKLSGLDVASVSLTKAANKDVLLIERFDRTPSEKGWSRRLMLSALTLFGLDEMMARYAGYQEFAENIRHKFSNPALTLKELFARISFNILIGNTDDHARNHAAFWDGNRLSLTPAYDICPQGRTGNEASQAMLIVGNNRMSQLSACFDTAHNFLLSEDDALSIIENQIAVICENWHSVCDKAELSPVDRNLLWRRQVLNPYAFEGLTGKRTVLSKMAEG